MRITRSKQTEVGRCSGAAQLSEVCFVLFALRMSRSLFSILAISLLSSSLTSEDNGADLADGWGEEYSWQPSLEAAISAAEVQSKPIMLVIHKSWCGACKNLKASFSVDDEAIDLSQDFVMVNLGDGKAPDDPKFKIDGSYVPRVYFLKPDGTILPDFYNKEGNPKFKFYYHSMDNLVDVMWEVLEESQKWDNSLDREEL